MPFAAASIGKCFRNEISPRAGLLRVREFLLAEIEHFVDPEGGKKHHRFNDVKDIELPLLNRHVQLSGKTTLEKVTIGKAVTDKIIDNETLGYFLGRIYLFLQKIGADPTKIRFRQHMANEMAHYAADCWDAELYTSYGWVECVGCADRSAYDLSVHAKKTGAPLVVRESRKEPLKIEEYVVELDKKKSGPKFKKDAKAVEAALDELSQDLREKLSLDLEKTGAITVDVNAIPAGKVELTKDLIKIEKRTRVENTREYTPNVIEPSFGIGRILYSVLEHSFWTREGDEARGVSETLSISSKPYANQIKRCFHSRRLQLPPKYFLFRCPTIPPSVLWSPKYQHYSVKTPSLIALMRHQSLLENDIAAMTNWAPRLALQSISRPFQTSR
jgi:glycyl-tRNA synthetase